MIRWDIWSPKTRKGNVCRFCGAYDDMEQQLTRAQFDLLAELATPKDDPAVAPMATETVFNAPRREGTMRELSAMGLIEGCAVTMRGFAALEPYRARRVILTAAGFGSRLVPVTYKMPKPLIRVHGQRLIETIIDAALAAGIEEIVVVRGYLGEQFDVLREKYPDVRLVDNRRYNESNNISSVLLVSDLLPNAYICDADLLVKKPTVFKKYHWCSNYLGIPMAHSDNWCFSMNGSVIASQQVGGDHCYQQIGVAYFDRATGLLAAEHIKETFKRPDGRKYFWDNAFFAFHAGEYHIEMRNCKADEDVLEIDTYDELCALDPSYKDFPEA